MNLYAIVSNNLIENIDKNGLWQITVMGGKGLTGYLTLGRNSGQWNVGARVGGGGGASISFDFSDGQKQSTGLQGVFPSIAVSGGILGAFGAGVDVAVTHPDGPNATLSGNVGPYTISAGAGIDFTGVKSKCFYHDSSLAGVAHGGFTAFVGGGFTYAW